MKYEDINVGELEFHDISEEQYRRYYYIDWLGGILTWYSFEFKDPIALNVSASGGHKLILSNGKSMYVKPGWIAFEYLPTKGRKNWRF